jgi:RsiW-degrading membrane proteinase PrsW (M82 family)
MLLLSVLPSIILFIIVWKGDRYEKEPPKLHIKLFLLGALTTVSASIIEIVGGDYIFGFLDHAGMLFLLIDNFLLVALSEEAGKYIVLKKVTWKHPAFNYTFDAVVYAVTASLGFATLENILYLIEGSFGTAITRAIFSVPGHVIDAIYMGYYYGLARHADAYNDQNLSKKYLRRAFFVPVLIHGFYDFCLSTENGFFIMVFLIFEIIITTLAIKKFLSLSKVAAVIPDSQDDQKS